MRFAVNPLQFHAGADGMLDFASGPPRPEILRACARAGFGAVQEDRFDELDATRRDLAAANLRAAPPYFSAAMVDPERHDAIAERFRRAVGYARALGLDRIVIADDMTRERFFSAGRHADAPADETDADAVAAVVSRLDAIGRAEGVHPAFHPHVGTHIESPAEIAALLARSPVALCPDTGHLAWAGVADVRDWMRRHRDRIAMLHLKDVDRATARRGVAAEWSFRRFVREGLWREPGTGDLDLAGVLDDFADTDLWCVVEVDAPHRRTAEESLAVGGAFIRAWED